MIEKQFELEGVAFGRGCPIELKGDGWTPGSASLRTSDVDNPSGDGVRMGRDFKGAATWSFSLYTNGETEEEAWTSLGDLAAIWDADDVRQESGAVLPLRYHLAGETRRVYGRPRRWTATPNNLSLGGRIDVEADFALTDHRVYDDVLNTKPFTLGVPLELDAGLQVPFIAPFTTAAGSAVREDVITVGGKVPTPVILTFEGPVSNARVQIGDWSASLVDPVVVGNPVTIDARPWVRSATVASGGGVRVTPRDTRISKMWLPPGNHTVIFTGTDITSTARVLVSWRNAYRTPR